MIHGSLHDIRPSFASDNFYAAGKTFARASNGILGNCNLRTFAVMAKFNAALSAHPYLKPL